MGTNPLEDEDTLESLGRLVHEKVAICPLGEVKGERRAGGVEVEVEMSWGGGLTGEVMAFGFTSCPLTAFSLPIVVTMGTGPWGMVSMASSASELLLESLESSESLLLDELELDPPLLLEELALPILRATSILPSSLGSMGCGLRAGRALMSALGSTCIGTADCSS